MVGDGRHGVCRRGRHDDVHAVIGDEVTGDGGGTVRVGLGVLDDELDRVDLTVAALEAVLDGRLPLLDAPGVRDAERGERTGERRHEADLDLAAGGAAAAPAAAAATAAAGGQRPAKGAAHAERGAGHGAHLEEIAPRHGPAQQFPYFDRSIVGLVVL
jgi:hypothetical protein